MSNSFRFGSHRSCLCRRRAGQLFAAMLLAVLVIAPQGGCSVGGSAGEGTVDLSQAKEAAKSNSDAAKAAAARGKGGLHDAQKRKAR
jgi:hypothetical protein